MDRACALALPLNTAGLICRAISGSNGHSGDPALTSPPIRPQVRKLRSDDFLPRSVPRNPIEPLSNATFIHDGYQIEKSAPFGAPR